MDKKIVLISCVSKKGKTKAKARELYKSPLFSKSLAYGVSLNPDKIFILSALHNLLDLDTEIEPYNVTLSKVPSKVRNKNPNLKVLSKEEAKLWGQKVIEQLSQVADLKRDTFIILAGQSYIKPIESGIRHIEQPLKGLTQGKRVGFLSSKLNTMPTLALRLHQLFNAQNRFSFPFKQRESDIPRNGIYVIFEKGETFQGFDRIVRVGTHTGEKQLRLRLNQHFVKENKNRSIFRKNIGRCLLNKDKSPYLPLWELDTTSRADRDKNSKLLDLNFEKQIEKRVSDYIQGNLSFCVFQVDTKEDRLCWERKIVSTLAKSTELKASTNWLGNSSPVGKIKQCSLWQVNELYKEDMTDDEFDMLCELVLKGL